ncbi:MAG: GNAT family N-acetyltransferase [Clostridia bacterium]|nr:GNAT family N-acetyltransferase [Clostridia bacterium]
MSHIHHLGTRPLETPRLLLRQFRPDDAPFIYANWASDPQVSRFWSWEAHSDLHVTEAVLAQWTAAYAQPDTYHWAIVLKETGQPIGAVFLDELEDDARSASVHYLLGRAFWNQGLTTEAVQRVLDFAFDELRLLRIHSRHHVLNPASGRVLEKCGMVYTETRQLDMAKCGGSYRFYICQQENHICK